MKLNKVLIAKELTAGQEIWKLELLPIIREAFPKMKMLELLSELSVIEMPDDAVIVRHRHIEDYEWLVMLTPKGVSISFCRNGGSHDIFNTTGGTMYIISIKMKVKDH